MLDLSEIASRFYPTEEARIHKMQALKGEMGSFYAIMKEIVEELWIRDIRFCIFEMLPYADPPRIHAGMVVCCANASSEIVTDKMRRNVADKISMLTKYKEVKWEI